MTVESFTPASVYTVAGIGPYAISHPYLDGAVRVRVTSGLSEVQLGSADATITPLATATTGNLFLTAPAAALYAGWTLTITRETTQQQGWAGTQGQREAGLEAQLDRMVMAEQETLAKGQLALDTALGAMRIDGVLRPFVPVEGATVVFTGGQPVAGPSVTAIAAAQGNAAQTASDRIAAALSAQNAATDRIAAQAAAASIPTFRGSWTSGIAYPAASVVLATNAGSTNLYFTSVAHTAGATFAGDLATKWTLFLPQGPVGPGSGDVVKSLNGSDFPDKAQVRTNIGLGTMAVEAKGTGGTQFRQNSDNDARFLAIAGEAANTLLGNLTGAPANAVANSLDTVLAWLGSSGNLGSNGYLKIPISATQKAIVQYLFTPVIAAGSNLFVSWPIVFPTTAFGIVASYVNTGGDIAYNTNVASQIRTIGPNGVTVRNLSVIAAQFYIFAIGV